MDGNHEWTRMDANGTRDEKGNYEIREMREKALKDNIRAHASLRLRILLGLLLLLLPHLLHLPVSFFHLPKVFLVSRSSPVGRLPVD